MLRLLFVSILLAVGVLFALRDAFSALLLYVWWAYFRPDYWVHTFFLRSLPISFMLGLYLVVRSTFSTDVSFRFDLRASLLLAILVLATLSTFSSPYVAFSILFFWDFARTLVVTYLISLFASDTNRLRIIILVMSLSLAFEGAKQGWAQMILNPTGVNQNPVAFIGDNNGVAVAMLMLLALLITLARTATWPWERRLHWFLGVGVLYRAISTYSRGGFLAAIGLAAVFVLRSPRRVPAIIGGTLAALLTLSVLPDVFWERMGTITVAEGERDTSATSRLHFWKIAGEMAKNRPLLGVGPNAFTVAYDAYDTSRGEFGRRRSVHNSWLGVLAEMGFLGLLFYVAILLLALVPCWQAQYYAHRGRVDVNLGHIGAGLESALVVCFIGGTFVIFQYTEFLWHVIGLSMGLRYVISQQLARTTAPVPSLDVPETESYGISATTPVAHTR